jgi:thiol-disulfide isomerase/thioredoxin
MKLSNIIIILISLVLFGAVLIYVRNLSLPALPTAINDNSVVGKDTEVALASWQNVELVDIRTKEKFRISDFEGKPILLESFAVWCPTCTKQQNEIKKLAEEKGDEIIHISLNTDPNEDAGKVFDHLTKNDFNWLYAISPIEMTRELTQVFGLTFVNAPSAPVALICPDQSYRFLKNGVKKFNELLEEIERGCSI